MSVTRRGAGCGSLAGDRRVARKAQVQAAPRRGTVPGDGGGAFHRWRWSRPVTRRARNADASVVRGDFARAESLTHPHEAAGFSESPAFRAPFSRAGMRLRLRRTPRRKEQGRRSYGW